MSVLWVTGDACGAQAPGQQCHARVDDVAGTSQPTQGASGLCLASDLRFTGRGAGAAGFCLP